MLVSLGIGSIALLVAGCLVGLLVRGGRLPLAGVIGVTGAVMSVQLALAWRGVFAEWDRTPPPIMLAIGASVLLVVALGSSPVGARMADRLPWVWLIGYQSFRLLLELLMHRAATTGLMPVQMSFSGWNFDIFSGALAIPVAALAVSGRAPRWLILIWNLAGSLLLANIIAIAVASTPMIGAFGPDRLNTWIAQPPYIWLPGVLVPAAVLGHLVAWRKLARH